MEILLFPLLAAFALSLISGSIGSFIIWNRMSYFGDSLAHSALLGIALGVIYSIPSSVSVVAVAIIFTAILYFLQNKNILSIDALLGILAHGSLALAMIIISLSKNPGIDLEKLLFGDILAVNIEQIYIILAVSLISLIVIAVNWQKLILISINKEIAIAKNVNEKLLRIIFISLIAVTVAISLKVVGTLLITSMLIIPASCAKQISYSPKIMAIFATAFAFFSNIAGILFSVKFSLLTGPSIVLCSVILFVATTIIASFKFKK